MISLKQNSTHILTDITQIFSQHYSLIEFGRYSSQCLIYSCRRRKLAKRVVDGLTGEKFACIKQAVGLK
jgi:hypothetical protein